MESDDDRQRATLLAVVSRGGECAAKDMPGVGTRISRHLEWINKHMGTTDRMESGEEEDREGRSGNSGGRWTPPQGRQMSRKDSDSGQQPSGSNAMPNSQVAPKAVPPPRVVPPPPPPKQIQPLKQPMQPLQPNSRGSHSNRNSRSSHSNPHQADNIQDPSSSLK